MTDFSITIYDECPVCKMPMNPMHEKNSDCGKTKIVCDDCDGECKSNETEKCEGCGAECRNGCANNPSDESIFNDLCDKCRDNEICPRCGTKWTKPDEVPCGCHIGDKYICWGATGGDLYIGLQTEEYMDDNYDEWGIFNELIDER